MSQVEGAAAQPGGGRSDPWSVAILRRRWARLAIAAVVALALARTGVWAYVRSTTPPPLVGAVLTPPIQAFDFHLPDQHGRVVSLSDLRGKAVALTFIYTHCPDVCPLIADNMGHVYRQLGNVANGVALVAISVDPKGDTPEAIQQFLKNHRVEGALTYLHGSFAQLRPVWAHYYVGSEAKEVKEAAAAFKQTPEQVGHTAIVYVLDPRGQIRVFLPANFDPKDLVTDLRLLAPAAR